MQIENRVKVSNRTGETTGFRVSDFQYMTLGKLILHRLLTNRDVKIIITSSGNTTGTGKTMLAIILCRVIAKYAQEIHGTNYNWNAEEHSFLNVYEYLNKYKEAESGEVLITDEMEFLADKRRSMSHENVHFSQAWQMLRYKNVITVGTAPSMANLDRRIAENSDIWINIIYPGYAHVYYLSMDDFTGKIKHKRLKQMGFSENIRWKPIDDDPDYKTLHEKKENVGIPGFNDSNDEEIYDKEQMEQQMEQTKDQMIEQMTIKLLKMKRANKIDMTQEDIAHLVDRSQQFVSKKKREVLP